MKDNLSVVITVIVLVMLMVIFPLYNYFERQDDMSYNLVLRATTNFVDTVLGSGYIDQESYDNFVNTIAATGNMYDIELEAHRKLLIKNPDNTSANEYIEAYEIDYNNDIFESLDNNLASVTSLGKKSLKAGAYKFNEGDQFYVKLSNSNTTMAGAIFNSIVPTAKKKRISVNYGGVIKNNSWKEVDSTYLVYSKDSNFVLKSTSHPNLKSSMHVLPSNANITFKAEANVSNWWSNPSYNWEIKYANGTSRIINSTTNYNAKAVQDGILTIDFSSSIGFNSVTAWAVSEEGQVTSSDLMTIYVANNAQSAAIVRAPDRQSAKGTISTPDKSILPDNIEVDWYTFAVDVSTGHSGEDYWRIIGIKRDGSEVDLTPKTEVKYPNGSTLLIRWGVGNYSNYRWTNNGVRVGSQISPMKVEESGIVQIRMEYVVTGSGHVNGCLKPYSNGGGSNVRYTIGYRSVEE